MIIFWEHGGLGKSNIKIKIPQKDLSPKIDVILLK